MNISTMIVVVIGMVIACLMGYRWGRYAGITKGIKMVDDFHDDAQQRYGNGKGWTAGDKWYMSGQMNAASEIALELTKKR